VAEVTVTALHPERRRALSRDRAAAIRRAREWANMSQLDLAKALGYQTAHPVWAWENCRVDPGPAMVARIAEVTRTRAAELLIPRPCQDPRPAGVTVRRAA
jgi:transcriptional regulator with XRE-family HTH domain